MDLNQRGIFLFSEGMDAREFAKRVQHIERCSYGAVWFPEAVGRDPLIACSFTLANTDRLIAATGIINVYVRDPMAAAMAQQTLVEQSHGRFLLGLGVSHGALVKLRGHVYGKPLATMRAYLEGLRRAHTMLAIKRNLLVEGLHEQTLGLGTRGALRSAVGEMPLVLAALGPKMTKLSGELAQGSHPANATPEHTARAREILGPGPLLCPMQRVCLCSDASTARRVGRLMMSFYLELPNYRNLWKSLGFQDADFDHGGSDRLIDAMLVWGNESDLHARVQAHLEAGADHVAIVPINAADPALPCWRAVDAMAPQ